MIRKLELNVKIRFALVTFSWSLIQGQIGYLILMRTRSPVWFLAIVLIALYTSLFLDEFEQMIQCWLISLPLTMFFIILFLPIPTYLGALPIEFAPIIIGSNISRILVSIMMIFAPLGFLGCCIGQMLRLAFFRD